MSAARNLAPEIPASLEWFNTANPVSLADLRGRLVLLEFAGSSSVQCIRALDELDRLGYRYRDELVVLCVHAPLFRAEIRRTHIRKFINRAGIRFPVVHDPDHLLSSLFEVSTLPTHVLIDRDGCMVGSMTGNGKFPRLEKVIDHQLGLHGARQASGSHPLQKQTDPEPKSSLLFPGRIAITRDRVYISDTGHNRILITSQDGHVVRQYGASEGGFVDGVGDSAAFRSPHGLVVVDEFLYVADTGNHAIRRINLQTDEVVTVAGNGTAADVLPAANALPANTPMNAPADVVHQAGRLFIAMAGMHQIWCLSLLNNRLEVLSGCGSAGLVDGGPAVACFAQPSGLAISGHRIYCVDAMSSSVRCVDPETGHVTTLVSGEKAVHGRQQNQVPDAAYRLQFPQAIGIDQTQKLLWVADTYNDQVCRIGISTQQISRLALDHALDEPAGLVFGNNTLYIANTNAHEILRVHPDNGHAEALNVSEEYSEI